MRWEELTCDEFAKAVVDCDRTCVIAMGVLERHGPHLPLGTDLLCAHYLATLAAQREPAVVFPQWYLGQIYEALCFPGTVAIPPKLLLDLMLAVFDEIGRNGFTKIVVYNGHGGNNPLVSFLAQCQLAERKPYHVYTLFFNAGLTQEQKDRFSQVMDAPTDRHAGEVETSLMMAMNPDLVKMETTEGLDPVPLGRLDHIKPGFTALNWYGDFPEHIAGNPAKASAEKGRIFADLLADSLAEFIRAVKNDTVMPELAGEFFGRKDQVGK